MSLALGSAFAYACYDVGVRVLIGDLTIWGMLFVRGCLGFLAIGLLARIFSRPLWGQQTGPLTAIGLFGFFSSACNSTALATIPLYQALMLIYTYPILTLLLAVPINREPITRRDLGLVGLAVLGGLALVWPDETIGLEFQIGHLAGLAGATLYSLGQVFIRRLGADNSGLEPLFHYSIYALVLSLPMAMLFGSDLGLGRLSGLGSALLLAVLGLSAQLTGFAALRWLPGFKVGIVGYLELAAGAVISWLIFNDPMSLRALGGGVLVVLVAFLLRWSAAEERSEKERRDLAERGLPSPVEDESE